MPWNGHQNASPPWRPKLAGHEQALACDHKKDFAGVSRLFEHLKQEEMKAYPRKLGGHGLHTSMTPTVAVARQKSSLDIPQKDNIKLEVTLFQLSHPEVQNRRLAPGPRFWKTARHSYIS
jgi:hypothetical protein